MFLAERSDAGLSVATCAYMELFNRFTTFGESDEVTTIPVVHEGSKGVGSRQLQQGTSGMSKTACELVLRT